MLQNQTSETKANARRIKPVEENTTNLFDVNPNHGGANTKFNEKQTSKKNGFLHLTAPH